MPVDPIVLLAFIPAALALNLTPGADMMFCFGQGLRHGPKASIAASLGISVGFYFQTIIAGLGVGAIVTAYPVAFDLIRWVGVAYLLWLAWKSLHAEPVTAYKSNSNFAFREGLIVNLTNPKVLLFIFAFIPQFIDPARGSVLLQFMVFSLVPFIGGFFINAAVGIFASGIGRQMMGSARFSRILGYVSASVFGLLAVRLAFWERT